MATATSAPAMATRTSLTTSASRREKTCGIGGA